MYGSPQLRAGTQAVSTPSLLGQVLGITGAGFLITAAAAYVSQGTPRGLSLIAMLVGFGFLIAISATRRNSALSLTMFYLFALCEGILTLAAIVYLTSFDYRRLSGIAFGALIALVLVGLISAFTHFLHPAIYSWATLAVFTLLVLVDFARIRAGGGYQTAVELAASIYLDAINIFLALLQIFGSRNRRD
jgi:FtsH-binding integral membrane protein